MASKDRRKTQRVVRKVVEETGVQTSENPTEILLACNAGLTTGASREALFELCFQNGSAPKAINLLAGKSYSFLTFESSDSAKRTLEAVQGKIGLPTSKSPLYLAYMKGVPSAVSQESPWEHEPPSGLTLVPGFVDEDEEESLLLSFNWQETGGKMKHRQVRHFGYDFVYGSNSISPEPNGSPFPDAWTPFLHRAVAQGLIPELPDQCTVNRYEPGQGIPPHVDTHSCCTSHIASLSLGSDTVMNFQHPDGEEAARRVLLPRRSLMIMTGTARYLYTHGITPRASDVVPAAEGQGLTLKKRGTRVSMTFRKTLRLPCNCDFPTHCDSRRQENLELNDKMALQLEKLHVHEIYEKIAGHFSDTRHTPWPNVAAFLSSFAPGSVIVDAGCGNGKYLTGNKDLFKVGCDRSSGLVGICSSKGAQSIIADCLNLPFKSECADGVISIAVIHHFSNEERRRRAISEIVRLLRKGGQALIYAWAKEQARSDSGRSKYLKKDTAGEEDGLNVSAPADKAVKCDTQFELVLPVHQNKTDFKHADLLVPWKSNKGSEDERETLHRFYHVYEEGELEESIEATIGHQVSVVKSYYDQGNWCVILRKK